MGCASSKVAPAEAAVDAISRTSHAERAAGAAGLAVASGAGEALLAVGAHLPWIAPHQVCLAHSAAAGPREEPLRPGPG